MKTLFVLLLLTTTLAGCTFTYLPPVPRSYDLEPTLRIDSGSSLTRQPEGLRLRLIVTEVPDADWVAVQWFDPRNDDVASTSVWVSPEDGMTSYDLFLPDDVTFVPGLWRAIVSYRGRVVRQIALQ